MVNVLGFRNDGMNRICKLISWPQVESGVQERRIRRRVGVRCFKIKGVWN